MPLVSFAYWYSSPSYGTVNLVTQTMMQQHRVEEMKKEKDGAMTGEEWLAWAEGQDFPAVQYSGFGNLALEEQKYLEAHAYRYEDKEGNALIPICVWHGSKQSVINCPDILRETLPKVSYYEFMMRYLRDDIRAAQDHIDRLNGISK